MKIFIHYDHPSTVSELVRKISAKGIDVSAGRGAPEEPVDWWIEWGEGKKIDLEAAERYFNVPWEQRRTGKSQMEAILSLNHLQAFLGDDGTDWPVSVWPKEYLLYLWDSKVVGVQRKILLTQQLRDLTSNKAFIPSFQWVDQLSPWEEERLAAIAMRALHCLGLDFGKVHLGINRSRGPILLGIERSPTVHKRLAQLYADAIVNSMEEWKREAVFSLGSDPEFMLFLTPGQRMVPASRFFPRTGVIGCDNRRAFGASDDLPLAEVRPEPAKTVTDAMKQLRSALHEANRLCPYSNVAWYAGSEPYPGYPIGGHIHFGGLRPNSQLIRALDQYLAMPLLFLENGETAARRRQFYGSLGDYRLKPHGFEYRTPSSWLTSPELAWVALSLASLVGRCYKYLCHWDFYQFEVQEAFYKGRVEELLPLLKTALLELNAVEPSEETKKLTQTFWSLYEKGQGMREEVDLRETWRLPVGLQRYRYVPRPRHNFSWITGNVMR
ncbi:hypothetical protein GJ688_03080 [Heliobacillus mobilis]|uniref:Phage phiEco32-like COOH.NH2 ligase-type 2 n=1 Tax=Heliobacterium mobile TaxID=28064 RepID=A0A6I3SGJ5_HELMO|nr:hypothetical protein [Heliobacterium mobile]MTV47961.1 hypothetical protein [Heliobacterium mobile]